MEEKGLDFYVYIEVPMGIETVQSREELNYAYAETTSHGRIMVMVAEPKALQQGSMRVS